LANPLFHIKSFENFYNINLQCQNYEKHRIQSELLGENMKAKLAAATAIAICHMRFLNRLNVKIITGVGIVGRI
jgi:hypothetical protein